MKKKIVAFCMAMLMTFALFTAAAGAQTLDGETLGKTPETQDDSLKQPSEPDPVAQSQTNDIDSDQAEKFNIKVENFCYDGFGTLGVKIGSGEEEQIFDQDIEKTEIDEGTQIKLTWKPDEDSYLKTLSINGKNVLTEEINAAGSYAFDLKTDTIVEAEFGLKNRGMGVAIFGPGKLGIKIGDNDEVKVSSYNEFLDIAVGTEITVKWYPNKDLDLSYLEVNEKEIPAGQGEYANSYTFKIEEDTSIYAEFGTFDEDVSMIELEIDGPGSLFMLENGKWIAVKPDENVIMADIGSKITFKAVPNTGSDLVLTLIDGEPVEYVQQEDGYIFELDVEDIYYYVGVMFIDGIEIGLLGRDENTGIEYYLPGTSVLPQSNITDDSWVEISSISSGKAHDTIKGLINKYGREFKAFDFSVKNKNGVYKPNVPAFIGIPLPKDYSTSAKDLHLLLITEDGSIKELEFELEKALDDANYIAFRSEGVGTFVIVDSSKAAPIDKDKDIDTTNTPKTGDNDYMLFMFILLATASGVITGVICKRFRKNKCIK